MKNNLREFSLSSLKIIYDLLLTKSLSLTAKNMHVSQSSVSHTLSKFRISLDDEILVRYGNKMMPTTKADETMILLSSIISRTEQLFVPSKAFNPKKEEASFNIIIHEFFELFFIHELMQRVGCYAPKVKIRFINYGFDYPLDYRAFKSPNIDLSISTLYRFSNCNHKRVITSKFVLIACKDNHHVVDNITMSDYFSYKHVGHNISAEYNKITGFLKGSDSRDFFCKVSSLFSIFCLLSGTKLVATVPKLYADVYADQFGLKIVGLPFKPEVVSGHIAWPKHLNNDPKNIWLREQVLASISMRKKS